MFEGGGGIDLNALRADRDDLLSSACADNTVDAYASDWRMFDKWCGEAGRRTLPANPETVQLYITWMFNQGARVSTCERRAASISHVHRVHGFPSPVESGLRRIIRTTRRRRKEQPIGKKALDVEQLIRVARKCDPATPIGARDRALIVLGFATSFRREELARLELGDITIEPRGLAILLRHSKRDQEGKGRLLGVWAGQREETDPVRTLSAWLGHRGEWSGALFCRIFRSHVKPDPLSGDTINYIVKQRLDRAGIDPKPYGAHSLRAGAITAAATLGRSDQEIMGLSGHESATVMRMYVRQSRLFAGRNPLAGVL